MKDLLGKLSGLQQVSDTRWKARCPAHEDLDPSLSIRVDEGVVLLRCYAGCSSKEVCEAVGLEYRRLCSGGGFMGKTRSTGPSEYDRRLWSRVYAYLLAELDRFLLLPSHRQELGQRGLEESDIIRGSYRSLSPERNEQAAAVIYREFANKIWDVPGIIRRLDRRPDLAVSHGLLIPMFDSEGWVKACQVRTGGKGSRYVWFTQGGQACPALHFSEPPRAGSPWVVTEGPLKANVAQSLYRRARPEGWPSNAVFVGCGGVSSWGSVIKAYDAMPAEERPEEVVVAFDVEDKLGTKSAASGLVEELKRRKIPTFQGVWEGAKGIDDALLVGASLKREEK